MNPQSPPNFPPSKPPIEIKNGAGAAALLAAAIGCAALGVLSLLGDAFESIGHLLNFYPPSGTLSGVSDVAIAIWLVAWAWLGSGWSNRDVALGRVCTASFLLLLVGFALTFPPFMDLLQGK